MPCGTETLLRIIWSACLGSMPRLKITSTLWSELRRLERLELLDAVLDAQRVFLKRLVALAVSLRAALRPSTSTASFFFVAMQTPGSPPTPESRRRRLPLFSRPRYGVPVKNGSGTVPTLAAMSIARGRGRGRLGRPEFARLQAAEVDDELVDDHSGIDHPEFQHVSARGCDRVRRRADRDVPTRSLAPRVAGLARRAAVDGEVDDLRRRRRRSRSRTAARGPREGDTSASNRRGSSRSPASRSTRSRIPTPARRRRRCCWRSSPASR